MKARVCLGGRIARVAHNRAGVALGAAVALGGVVMHLALPRLAQRTLRIARALLHPESTHHGQGPRIFKDFDSL